MEQWWTRVQAELQRSGRRPADLARALGISRASISDWLKGATGQPKPENLFVCADFLGVKPQWLLTGKGEKYAEQLEEDETELLDLYRGLDAEGRESLLQFAQFLGSHRSSSAPYSSARKSPAPALHDRGRAPRPPRR